LSLKIVGVINPNSTQPVKGISIKTYDEGFMVDQIIDQNFLLYSLKPGLFYSARVSSSSNYAFSQSDVSFELNIADPIP